MQTGKKFESECIEAYQWYAAKRGLVLPHNKAFMDIPVIEEDKNEGTDLIEGDIRTDFTMNFDGKDHMSKIFPQKIVLSATGRLPDICYGIRVGNNHVSENGMITEHIFRYPVLVVGVTMTAGTYRIIHDPFMDAFYQKIEQIVQTGEDLYYTYTDNL